MYIIAGIFAFWFASVSRIPQYISGVLFNFGIRKKYFESEIPIRLLPFDCDKCLGFWLGLSVSIPQNSLTDSVLLAGASSLIAYTLNLILNKLR